MEAGQEVVLEEAAEVVEAKRNGSNHLNAVSPNLSALELVAVDIVMGMVLTVAEMVPGTPRGRKRRVEQASAAGQMPNLLSGLSC